MPFELSWRPGGSVGLLINLFGFFELTMVVVRGREVSLISYSIIGLAEGTPQVRKVITGLSLEANGLYCRQLTLLDPAHQIPRSFVSRCYLSNPVVEKAPFSLSSFRAKEEPVQALSCSSVSL